MKQPLGPDRADSSQQMHYEAALLLRAVRRLNSFILGSVVGIMLGLVLFAATLWLVIKGGDVVGPHMALLANFFPGYRVSVLGSFVGFAYGFVSGFGAGWLMGFVYNAIASRRSALT